VTSRSMRCTACLKRLRPIERHSRAYAFCHSCEREKTFLAAKAHGHVAFLVASGKLPKVQTCACVDCGKKAQHYDHRDYHATAEVQPVCSGCNTRRGPAKPFSTFYRGPQTSIDKAALLRALAAEAGSKPPRKRPIPRIRASEELR